MKFLTHWQHLLVLYLYIGTNLNTLRRLFRAVLAKIDQNEQPAGKQASRTQLAACRRPRPRPTLRTTTVWIWRHQHACRRNLDPLERRDRRVLCSDTALPNRIRTTYLLEQLCKQPHDNNIYVFITILRLFTLGITNAVIQCISKSLCKPFGQNFKFLKTCSTTNEHLLVSNIFRIIGYICAYVFRKKSNSSVIVL